MNTDIKTTINEAGPNGDVSWMGRDGNGKRWEDYETIKCPDGQVIDMSKLLDEQQRAKAALIHLFPFFNAFLTYETDIFNLLAISSSVYISKSFQLYHLRNRLYNVVSIVF